MGVSRKLQGEIDRVLKKVQEGVELFDSIWNKVYDKDNANQKEKYEADLKKEIKRLQRYRDQIKIWMQSSEIKDKKVSASYEKALRKAHKQIEREMERFKICEKEAKTKTFSKEGLGQQPKAEKAKAETREWMNNVVGELESQVDNFEAEVEGLTVKKGRNRPPRLMHLETSITRHKAHIMKLELILRLLENDELSAEQVNDVKDFLEDYVERNQDDFDEFSDVDQLYESLPLDKVEALEDLVTIGPPSLVKSGVATSSAVSLKAPMDLSSSQIPAAVIPPQESVPSLEWIDGVASVDNNSDSVPEAPSKSKQVNVSSVTSPVGSHTNSIPVNVSSQPLATPASTAASIPFSARGVIEREGAYMSSSSLNLTRVPEDDALNLTGRRASTTFTESEVVKGIGMPEITGQSHNVPLHSEAAIPSSGLTLGTVPLTSDVGKRNILGADENLLSSGMLQANSFDKILLSTNSVDGTGSADFSHVGDPPVVAGKAFTSSIVSGMQWRPESPFQNTNEMGQFRGKTEIAPDHREKFLQKFQQVQLQQQGPSNLLGRQSFGGGNHKQVTGQQQNPLPQQLNSQSSAPPSQVRLVLGLHAPGLNTAMPASLEQRFTSMHPQTAQQGLLLNGPKNPDDTHDSAEQHLQNLSDDSTAEVAQAPVAVSGNITDLDLKAAFPMDVPGRALSRQLIESGELQRDNNLSSGKTLQSNQPSSSLGVIGRRSVLDLLENLVVSRSSVAEWVQEQLYNFTVLESAYYKIHKPEDSERLRSYTPRHPAVTPPNYPQAQAPVLSNPAFWDRMSHMKESFDTLFFAFYFQQNTYQQCLAAKALKKQAWRFHRKYNTWFQRHMGPEVALDDYEKGSYVYFDYHVGDDGQGWCQRIAGVHF